MSQKATDKYYSMFPKDFGRENLNMLVPIGPDGKKLNQDHLNDLVNTEFDGHAMLNHPPCMIIKYTGEKDRVIPYTSYLERRFSDDPSRWKAFTHPGFGYGGYTEETSKELDKVIIINIKKIADRVLEKMR